MTVITARPRWLRKSGGTFTAIHTIWILVNSLVLVMALLSHQVEKITLDFTRQPTHYTDAALGIMPQRSGGLENSKFFIENTPVETQLSLFEYTTICLHFFLLKQGYRRKHLCYLKKAKLQASRTNIPLEEGMSIVCSGITVQFVIGWCDCIYSGIHKFSCINIDEAT